MASLQTYDRGAFFLDGQLLIESQSVSVTVDPKLNEVTTTQKGFAGVSPGAEMTSIDVASALPRSGVEYDALLVIQGVEIVEALLFVGAAKYKAKGYINNLKIETGTDRAASYSFTMICGPMEKSDF
jgi:hypothetical protein